MKTDQKAVSLKYEQQQAAAPQITAKGKGLIADKIIELAELNQIPIYKDTILSEILSKMDIGCDIPEYLYEVIAEIYSYTYEISKKDVRN